MLRHEPVSDLVGEIESERDGLIQHKSERDVPKVGVIPSTASVVRRS